MSTTPTSPLKVGANPATNPMADSAPPWSAPAVASAFSIANGLNPIDRSGPPTAPAASTAEAPAIDSSGFTNPSAVSASPNAPPGSRSLPLESLVENDYGRSGPPNEAPAEEPEQKIEGLNSTTASDPPTEEDDDPVEVSKPSRSRPGRSRRSPRSRS